MTTPSGPVEVRSRLGAEQVLTYLQPSVKLTNGVATWLHFDPPGSVRVLTGAGVVKASPAFRLQDAPPSGIQGGSRRTRP